MCSIRLVKKLKPIQYSAALAITGVMRATSREKLYHEFDFESLLSRRRHRKLCCFYKDSETISSKAFCSKLTPEILLTCIRALWPQHTTYNKQVQVF